MVSMNDIAKKLNISRTTVSNIINDREVSKTYKKETVFLVKETAKEMGYIPNNMAIAINTGITMTLAIIVPELSNTYYIKIISHVEEFSSKHGYRLLIFTSEDSVEKENEIIQYLMRQRVDGLLIAPVSYENSLLFDNIPFEVVCFDRKTNQNHFFSITIDNFKFTENLIKNNISEDDKFDNVYYIGGSMDDNTVVDRLASAKKTLGNFNLLISKIYYNIFENAHSYELAKDIMANSSKTESILFILSSSFFSLGIVKCMKEFGHNDYKILAFEHMYAIDVIDADIKVIDQPVEKIATEAFDTLLKLIQRSKVNQ